MTFYLPIIEIFLAMLGFAFSILFCTTFCRACRRMRQEEQARQRCGHGERDGRPPPIYFIPFPGSASQRDGEDRERTQDPSAPPRYSTTVYYEAPPSYNELTRKPEDLPPPYTEYSAPVRHAPHTDLAQAQTQSPP